MDYEPRTGEEQRAHRMSAWLQAVGRLVGDKRGTDLTDSELEILKNLYDSGLDAPEAAKKLLNPRTQGQAPPANIPAAQQLEGLRITRSRLAEIVRTTLNERAKNPWAICTASVGRKDKAKYERCVKGVKSDMKESKVPRTFRKNDDLLEVIRRLKRKR